MCKNTLAPVVFKASLALCFNFYLISVHMYVCGVYACSVFVSAQLYGSVCAYARMLTLDIDAEFLS